MTKDQISVIRFAYLDLMGAKEAADKGDIHSHDWGTHWQTIKDMETQFGEELSDLVVFGE